MNNETKTCKRCGRVLPIEQMYRNVFGVSNVCCECRKEAYHATMAKRKERKDLVEQLEDAKSARLSSFTPRELMQELKRRGYEGTLTYMEVHTIDLNKEF